MSKVQRILDKCQSLSEEDTDLLRAALSLDVDDVELARQHMGPRGVGTGAVGMSGCTEPLPPEEQARRDRRDHELIAAGNELDRVSIERSDANGTIRLPERVAILARRFSQVLTEKPIGPDEAPDGWQGTEPAEGTRRHLIRKAIETVAIQARAQSTTAHFSLLLADAVESALLKSTIAAEESRTDAQEAIANVGEVLDAYDAPQAPTYAQRIQRLCTELEDQRDLANESSSRKRELIEVTESADRLREQRESARAGEDRYKAERDAALHLLRWLIGDLIPPELVGLHKDEDDENCEGMGV